VLVVILDTKSSNTPTEIKSNAIPLEKLAIRVIPVAIGAEPDPNQLEKTTSNKENLIRVSKDEKPNQIGQTIMDKILKRK